jgi:hypothetical protein
MPFFINYICNVYCRSFIGQKKSIPEADNWLPTRTQIAENTRRAYRTCIDHLNELISNKLLQKVTLVDIENAYSLLLETHYGTSVQLYHRVLSAALKAAER